MDLKKYISSYHRTQQEEIWKRFTEFLSTRELRDVMRNVENGETLYSAHDKLGLISKYQIELLRICEILNRRN